MHFRNGSKRYIRFILCLYGVGTEVFFYCEISRKWNFRMNGKKNETNNFSSTSHFIQLEMMWDVVCWTVRAIRNCLESIVYFVCVWLILFRLVKAFGWLNISAFMFHNTCISATLVFFLFFWTPTMMTQTENDYTFNPKYKLWMDLSWCFTCLDISQSEWEYERKRYVCLPANIMRNNQVDQPTDRPSG